MVKRALRTAILAVKPSSLFGKVDKQFLLPHTAIAEAVGPQASHQEIIQAMQYSEMILHSVCRKDFQAVQYSLPEKTKCFGFALAEKKQMLLLAVAGGLTCSE